jgi:hypothetical protein
MVGRIPEPVEMRILTYLIQKTGIPMIRWRCPVQPITGMDVLRKQE